MRIARVFPQRTIATPDDELSFVGDPPKLRGLLPEIDEVHISVTFTYDLPEAERLQKVWSEIAPAKIGGPATGMVGEDFTPGMYLKRGYTITSRGCPNRCWFCEVWRRDGNVRELPIKDGWIIQDDNLLACSEPHIKAVFKMLQRQPERAQFAGGLEAARLEDWHVNLLWNLKPKPKQLFFAYDTPDDLEYLIRAGKLLYRANFTRSHCRCYVLIGHPGDTLAAAEKRCLEAWDAGFLPFSMLWRGKGERLDSEWRALHRTWCRPAGTVAHMQDVLRKEGVCNA